MDVVHARCCGLDVHKRTVVACLLTSASGGEPSKEVRTFGAMTDDLLRLADWLTSVGCTHVAMESTGVYWKPVYNLLEGAVEVLVVNARHIKAVPGRKTDVKDCEWIAELLRHGLLHPSFIPDRPKRELRELTRDRTSLIQERAAEVNRLQQVLEGGNIKLAAVATDIMGTSGREILAALVGGTSEPATLAQLAQLARGRLREKIPQLQQALAGQFGVHQRFMVAQQLAHIDFLDELIERVSAEIAERMHPFADAPFCGCTLLRMHPFAEAVTLLDTIPGVGRRTAEVLVAEIGADMTRFPSAAHLAAWAGLAPGNNESAGKRRHAPMRKGSPWLRAALVEAAQAAARTKSTYLGAQFRRLLPRKGKKRSAVAVGSRGRA